jgi:hypothetical protein
MSGVSSEPVSIDLTNPYDLEHAVRVGTAWIELRRGATSGALRDYLYGSLAPSSASSTTGSPSATRPPRTAAS